MGKLKVTNNNISIFDSIYPKLKGRLKGKIIITSTPSGSTPWNTTIMNKSKRTYPQLIDGFDLDKWKEINESELDCIFAETGADREFDFDREFEEEKLFMQQF